MKIIMAVAGWIALSCAAQEWREATAGWRYQFPRDHHVHSSFKTEWWYFTGNLFDGSGRRFGFELTFFRQGILPPGEQKPERSRFIVSDFKFAHFTVTDPAGQKFRYQQKAARGAFGEAGFDRGDRLAWIDDWNLRLDPGGRFQLAANMSGASLRLVLVPEEQPLVHGINGISVKASGGPHHASHYYSVPRLSTRGTLRIDEKEYRVNGSSWFDHEWATNQLAPNQVGWNWLCVQFADGAALMLYQMRLADGTIDLASSGTFAPAHAAVVHLASNDFSMAPLSQWHSAKTGATYPVSWQVDVPAVGLQFRIQPVMKDQELALQPLAYWEGAVDVNGKRAAEDVKGMGYLELTGYAGPLRELAR